MTYHPLSTGVQLELARLGGTIPADFKPRNDMVVPTPAGEHVLPRAVQALLAVEWPAGHVLLCKEKHGWKIRKKLNWEVRLPAPAPTEPGFRRGDRAWFTVGHDWRGHRLMVDLLRLDDKYDPTVHRFDADGGWFNSRPLSALLRDASAPRPAAKKNALARSAARGDVATARTLIAVGASVGAIDANGVTPLHMAALTSSSPEMVRLLADAGADVNAAITADAPARLGTIIENGRLSGRELGPGETPLGAALQGRGSEDRGRPITPEVVAELLRAGADPNIPDGEGRTPLHRACDAHRENAAELVAMLLAAGADPDPPTGDLSPLWMAHTHEIGDLLLKAGADPCRATNASYWGAAGLTPLHGNARWDDLGLLWPMVKAAGDVDVRTADGVTPLHMAAMDLGLAYMLILLDAGADPNARMNDGTEFGGLFGPGAHTPLDLARYRERDDAVALMEKYA